MNFDKSFLKRNFFRFTGPPENWLTAIKYMTWGLERKYQSRWAEIQPGDVFFMHSTLAGSKFKNIKSSILGLGVVGGNFTIKDSYLWIKEQEGKTNIWPLLVPFSEIYLFSDLPNASTWEAPTANNQWQIQNLINILLSKAIPLSAINRFPQMGSFSSVSDEVVQQIINSSSNLYLTLGNEINYGKDAKQTPFMVVKDASESLRYAATLQIFDKVNKRIINKKPILYSKDNELLSRAEDSHARTLQELIDIFRSKNYETYQNRYVDLFAVNEKQSFLIEVKSIENKNFRSQARKGIVQLFEYEYFEVKKFITETNLQNRKNYKMLVPSQKPRDENYISFINYLDTDVGIVEDHKIQTVGRPIGVDKI